MVSTAEEKRAAADAWARFCDSLKAAGDQLLRDDFPIDSLDLAEGLRYLARLTFASVERFVEGADPVHPHLYPLCNERIKVGGENPDNKYFAAAVSHEHSYVLRGDFRDCDYFSVIATGRILGEPDDDEASPVRSISGALSKETLVLNEDGTADIHIGATKAGANHLELDEHANLILVRCTIETPVDADLGITFERIGEPIVPDPLTLDDIETRLEEAAQFVRQASSYFGDWTAEQQVDVNTVPLGNQPYIQSVGGDPNILYYLSTWAVGPDEVLVLHIPSIPPATTWNFQLCNVWMESLDYTNSQIHVNSQTAHYDEDGGVTITVAERDPNGTNWLRTLGHRTGTVCLRLVGADEPLVVEAKVVPLEARAK